MKKEQNPNYVLVEKIDFHRDNIADLAETNHPREFDQIYPFPASEAER